MQEQLERDLKAALLSGDKIKAETLRGLKSVLLNEMIATGTRESGLSDEQIQRALSRESKKRAEAAELYKKAGETERAEKELTEKEIIDGYLPEQLSEEKIAAKVKEEVGKLDNPTPADMGRIVGAVRAQLGAQADGATIAKLVKEALSE